MVSCLREVYKSTFGIISISSFNTKWLLPFTLNIPLQANVIFFVYSKQSNAQFVAFLIITIISLIIYCYPLYSFTFRRDASQSTVWPQLKVKLSRKHKDKAALFSLTAAIRAEHQPAHAWNKKQRNCEGHTCLSQEDESRPASWGPIKPFHKQLQSPLNNDNSIRIECLSAAQTHSDPEETYDWGGSIFQIIVLWTSQRQKMWRLLMSIISSDSNPFGTVVTHSTHDIIPLWSPKNEKLECSLHNKPFVTIRPSARHHV